MNFLLIIFGKLLAAIIRTLNLGHGSTWPGHIALSVKNNFIKEIIKANPKLKIILIAGTNGKTTTSKLIQSILEKNSKKVILNESGANLLNGLASSLLLRSSILGKISQDFAIFEVDENTLPLALKEFTPDFIILLNLFRDQLDRYGEVNTISSKWKDAILHLPSKTKLILNANDPLIAYLGNNKSLYFGLEEKSNISQLQDWADSVFCPKCNSKLDFEKIYFSHIGIWNCVNCKFKTPDIDLSESPYYPLPGTYNKFNILAAVLFAKLNNVSNQAIKQSLKTFNPAFGRQEKIKINGKNIQIFLSKNPTSFNESLRTISNGRSLLLVLNDKIPDGRDVSWIWDVDFENLIKNFSSIVISGDRAYDLGLRIKYASPKKFEIEENLEKAIKKALRNTTFNQTLYILPTYSAMLDIRKILTGKKIL